MIGNRQVRVVARPEGIPQAKHFTIAEEAIPTPGAAQILVRNRFLSVDPAMRGWLADTGNYSQPIEIGAVMRALAVGTVARSNDPAFAEGDVLLGWFGWQDWAAVDPQAIVRKVTEDDLPASLALGILGLNGVTALLALEKIGLPRAGDTVLVSTAAGAVGSAVGQIANIWGCRTVGITGSADKARICVDEFGYDTAIDYRAPGLDEAIARACPDGIDVYFDNTAGSISDAALRHLAVGARIVVCGTASVPRWDPAPNGPRVERQMLVKRARMEGFVIFDHMADFDLAVARLASWIRAGRLAYREEIIDGIEHCPGAIADLYSGVNLGKRIIRLP